MPKRAHLLHPADRSYQGTRTQPERWRHWQPHEGDIIVCTPAKCGTTWTQSILTMLLYGTVDLPDRVSALSPWVDSSLGDADHVADVPLGQSGRRVVKTHTPADGYPVWDGVRVVAVYRHPLDVLLSVRNHLTNMKDVDGATLIGPLPEALSHYLEGPFDAQNCDNDRLDSLTTHYLRTVHRSYQQGLVVIHYSDMIADHRGAVVRLADALDIEADDTLLDQITEATRLDAMRSHAKGFAPEGGKGFWHDDAAFFNTGGTRQWEQVIDPTGVDRFDARLKALLPDATDRKWIKYGNQADEFKFKS